MSTATSSYLGDLRISSTHVRSGNEIITDAPIDNHGKGAAFSPTDLLATSLLNCMITVIGIKANQKGIKAGEINGNVNKVMASGPRRVSRLEIMISFTSFELTDAEKKLLEQTALNCPVAKSIHPDITTTVEFIYNEKRP